MNRIYYLILTTTFYNVIYVYCSSIDTVNGMPVTLSNLTSGNDLWSTILRSCVPPTFNCIRNNINEYLQRTLDDPNDIEFASFLKFPKNLLDYNNKTSLRGDFNQTADSTPIFNDSTSLEEISRSLTENAKHFFMTHDLELQLPQTFFMGTTVKVSPRSIEGNGVLVKLEVIPKSIKDSIGEGRLFFKRIRKFISERLIYALLAILLVIKLLAVKILFVLPTIVGVAAAKKLILKVLLFLFPALHHLFKLCAYVPHGAKHHIHKHQISHIHEISHHPHHYGSHYKRNGYGEANASQGPSLHPHYEPYEIVGQGHIKTPYFEVENSVHRKDLDLVNNEIGIWSQSQGIVPTKHVNSERPLTPSDIKNMVLMAEREAEIKTRLQKQRQKIHKENLRRQEQLSNVWKNQQKFKQQAGNMFNTKLESTTLATIDSNKAQPSQFQKVPQKNPSTSVGQITLGSDISTALFHSLKEENKLSNQNQLQPLQKPLQNKYYETYRGDTKLDGNDVKGNIYDVATITYDPFYSPILEVIDKILQVFGYDNEHCKERLICSMYKNPTKFSPHSNLLSAELSRDSKDLQKPTSTNAAVIRFYKYVQAARDGQDQRDCIKLYPFCTINSEL